MINGNVEWNTHFIVCIPSDQNVDSPFHPSPIERQKVRNHMLCIICYTYCLVHISCVIHWEEMMIVPHCDQRKCGIHISSSVFPAIKIWNPHFTPLPIEREKVRNHMLCIGLLYILSITKSLDSHFMLYSLGRDENGSTLRSTEMWIPHFIVCTPSDQNVESTFHPSSHQKREDENHMLCTVMLFILSIILKVWIISSSVFPAIKMLIPHFTHSQRKGERNVEST